LNLETIQNTYRHFRGGSRGTPNNCAGEQNSNYLLRKTKQFLLYCTGRQVQSTLNPLLHLY